MNLSKYLIYIPYRIVWNLRKLFSSSQEIHFLCGNIIDYICFKNIYTLMPEIRIIARNKKIKKKLREYNVKASLYPSFPDIIIMARHLARKYPEPKIVKIGMRHGAYHFKDFVSSKRYNAFDEYFVTSKREVELARQKGINNAVAVGYPKLDNAFNGKYNPKVLAKYKKKIELNAAKPTIIFTSTWDKSKMSAIEKWVNRLAELTDSYNILVSLHPWVSHKYKAIIKLTRNVTYISDKNVLPYLLISDLMIADMSSIIAEFCALDKPIVTFEIKKGKRLSSEIIEMLENISYRINTFSELKKAIRNGLDNPAELSTQRKKYNKIMFDRLDGKASQRVVTRIKKYKG